jgi:hypothetical protein
MQVGDEVKHRSRPDVGVGKITKITSDNLCDVKFLSCEISGIPLNKIGTVNQIKQERLEKEAAELAKQSTTEKFSQFGITCLWHLTHKNNVSSILKNGILNHQDALKQSANRVDITDPDVQRWRVNVDPHYKRRIHEYAPLYLKPRNPMLYVMRHKQNDLCFVEISLSVVDDGSFLITDGNAASRETNYYRSITDLAALPWTVLNAKFWPEHEDGKRKMCSEVLIYPKIKPNHIAAIHCQSKETKDTLSKYGINAMVSSNLFF